MKLKKLIVSSIMFVFMINSIFISQIFAKNDFGEDIVSVEVSNGQYKKVSKVMKSSATSETKKIIKARKKKGSKGIYLVDGKKEYLLKVTEDQFQPVGELTLNVASPSGIDTLDALNIGQEVKEELLKYADYAKSNGIANANISIYSPGLLANSNDEVSILGKTSTYFYYQGTGGYTYKQESIFYENWRSKTHLTYHDSNEELMAFLNKNISYAADTGIGLIPFYGQGYSLIKHFATLAYSAPIEDFQGSELATQIEETSRESRFCYIRQNLGSGMQDYLKAKSCFTNPIWHETLSIQGGDRESKVVKEEYYEGPYFNNLDSKAYAYRSKNASYDERLQSLTHSETNQTFNLAP